MLIYLFWLAQGSQAVFDTWHNSLYVIQQAQRKAVSMLQVTYSTQSSSQHWFLFIPGVLEFFSTVTQGKQGSLKRYPRDKNSTHAIPFTFMLYV